MEKIIYLFIVLEYVGPRYRTFIANMSIALFFGTGACAIPWIALYLNNWKLLSICTSVPLLLSIFTPWVVPESARYEDNHKPIKYISPKMCLSPRKN